MQSTRENEVSFSSVNGLTIPMRKTISGDQNNNILSGDANISEYIFGWGGNDTIYGGPSDLLDGGSGDDVLIGAIGSNYFAPGAGFDTIVMNDLGVGYRDEIFKFHASEDKIQLNSAVFKGLNAGVLSADLFYIGEKGMGNWNPGAEDRFLYDKTQGTLDFKTETGAVVRLAVMSMEWNSPDLSHVNFFIV